jgi:hypothetical protein
MSGKFSMSSLNNTFNGIIPYDISGSLRELESSNGTHPDTPKAKKLKLVIPPANGNEQQRVIPYNSGYAGQYGLTPTALSELAKSVVDKSAPVSSYTKFGPPVISGMSPDEIQKELLTPEGAGRLANRYFLSKRDNKGDYSPQALANDYINNYVGKGTKSDTPANRVRALKHFQEKLWKSN